MAAMSILALVPLLSVLGLMVFRRWGAHQAGLAGWLAGLVIAAGWFGLTPQVWCVSQAKGLLLSFIVLAVLWPALFLFYWIDQNGGIKAIAHGFSAAVPDRGFCLVLLAWVLSGFLEGLAGFGLPIAVVAPMLVALGVRPVLAVTVVAVGHSWAVTFGDMGVIYQTLVTVVGLPGRSLVAPAALLLGIACLGCGWLTAVLLGQIRHWWRIAALAVLMGVIQYGFAVLDLIPLAALGAGLAGLLAAMIAGWLGRLARGDEQGANGYGQPGEPCIASPNKEKAGMRLAVTTYGGLIALMVVLSLPPAVRDTVSQWRYQAAFPEVTTRTGFVTPQGLGPAFRPALHPGCLMLVVAVISVTVWRLRTGRATGWQRAWQATRRSATCATVGILFMVGLSTLMDHTGMSFQLAQSLSHALGSFYPVLAPCVGILGAFATGSNNNSNVLFGPLQRDVAGLLHIKPEVLVAAQTAGGSLGSMLAPAKVVVGCSTVQAAGQEGAVLRRTVPCGLVLGLVLGVATLLLARL